MASTIDLLNLVMAYHSASLPRYLAYAKPYVGSGDTKAMRLFRLIGEDHFRTMNLVGHAILRKGGTIQASEFPMVYTDMHDLSVDYMFAEVQKQNAELIDELESIIEQVQDDAEALAVVRESLGAAKAHREQIEELAANHSA